MRLYISKKNLCIINNKGKLGISVVNIGKITNQIDDTDSF